MTTLMPRDAAVLAHSITPAGSRWAEQIFTSCSIPKAWRCVVQLSIRGRSDLLPRITPTSGKAWCLLGYVAAVKSSVESYPADRFQHRLARLGDGVAEGDQRQPPAAGGDKALAGHVAGAGVEDQDAGRHRRKAVDREPRLVVVRVAARRHDDADARPWIPLQLPHRGEVATRRLQHQPHGVAPEPRQDDLRLGVAEPGVELEDPDPFLGQHQAGIKHS